MMRLIKEQSNRKIIILKGILWISLLFFTGCSSLKTGINLEEKTLSCSEKAEKKSLQYLEQQYRCRAK